MEKEDRLMEQESTGSQKTQFKPGQSGNLAGRPKGSKNLPKTPERLIGEILKQKSTKLLNKAVSIALNDQHPNQTKMLSLLIHKFMPSLQAQKINLEVSEGDALSLMAADMISKIEMKDKSTIISPPNIIEVRH